MSIALSNIVKDAFDWELAIKVALTVAMAILIIAIIATLIKEKCAEKKTVICMCNKGEQDAATTGDNKSESKTDKRGVRDVASTEQKAADNDG